ncbi:hypothetical protein T459_11438 [Capsicum annuum]|uniref:Uncharacterized protein n=1 Tax=Capsicum annuum TaxID=4072 RepID=A0A2G2ZM27_CAPAN|nr:hypothetical protein T459_11438 [Capsicum annuum]
METSALEALNVENSFTGVLNQIYRVVSRKALDIGDDPESVPRGQQLTLGKMMHLLLRKVEVVLVKQNDRSRGESRI